jgi:hypothetical protein
MASETESLAVQLVRALSDAPDSLLQHWRMPEELDRRTAEAILFAVARGWVVVQGNHSICLTDAGGRLVAVTR